MTVRLINAYSTRNLGDAAIYAALSRLSPTKRVCVDLPDVNPTLVAGLELRKIIPHQCTSISVGGDIFNNGRPGLVTRHYLSMLRDLAAHPDRTFIFGQSIPPSCHGFAFKLLTRTMRSLSSVAVRDERSWKRVSAAGVNAELTYDAAFALSPRNAAIQAALGVYDKLEVDPGRAVIISLRGGSPLYDADDERTLSQFRDLIAQLIARGHQPALLIQSDHDAADSDRIQARHLLETFPKIAVFDPFDVAPPIAPWEMCAAYLALANSVLGLRYHAAVLRLISGRTPYVLHYSNKGEDLCRRLGLPGGKLGQADTTDVIKGLEASADKLFDPKPLAHHVRQTFDDCFARANARLAA